MSPKPMPHPLRGCLTQVSFFCLIGVFVSAPFVLLPMHTCPQPCCDRPGKLNRLRSLPGVSPQEAQRMLDWAEPFPCAYSGMRRKVNLFQLLRY